MKKLFFLFLSLTLISCNNYNSKWEEIKGSGISEGESLENAIYFQDSLNGIIGGYKFVENKKSKNLDKLDTHPVLYLTKNGGKNWILVNIENVQDGVRNVKLENDTIICQIDAMLLKSFNLGRTWEVVEKSSYKEIREKYFPCANPSGMVNFKFENKNYRVKESYKHKNTEVIVCYGEESLTDYYFITKNGGKTWEFLQDELGSNKSKFLLGDAYLFAFDSQYGLQKLKLY